MGDMKLSLQDTFSFCQDTASDFDCPPLPFDGIVKQDRGTIDLARFPMKGTYACKVIVSSQQEVHFIHAVKWALRIVLSQQDPKKLSELDKVDGKSDLARLEEAQTRRLHLNETMVGESALLSVLVATAKIQERFRMVQAKTQNRRREAGETHADGSQPRAAG